MKYTEQKQAIQAARIANLQRLLEVKDFRLMNLENGIESLKIKWAISKR